MIPIQSEKINFAIHKTFPNSEVVCTDVATDLKFNLKKQIDSKNSTNTFQMQHID
ncbi:hypothetical protein LEP1GSC073_1690 [Leptospira noguchii str. Cascata]|nr:hypothetical protein LEP1GSC073_1178 [Leptospira noguchii str. Cascata]EMS87464.1 hypothetical protein LEP1GSC073_1690 [Leptospira noguchii str. Cascata]